jgi:hypothetical protein
MPGSHAFGHEVAQQAVGFSVEVFGDLGVSGIHQVVEELAEFCGVALGGGDTEQVAPGDVAGSCGFGKPGLVDGPAGAGDIAAVEAELDDAVRGVDDGGGQVVWLDSDVGSHT